jgi:Bacterial Ig-like domain
MNEASVESQGTFTLQAEGSSTPVEATVTYNSSTKSATLDPGTDLALNTTYTATLTTEAKDLGGNALAQERTWTFKTANAPRIVTVTPATLDFGNIVGTFFSGCSRTLTLTVTNNSSYDVTYGGVSITGTPAGRYFVTGLETSIQQVGPRPQPAGYHFIDNVTIYASGRQTYDQKLIYLDDTGAPIGNPVTLKATSECIVVG